MESALLFEILPPAVLLVAGALALTAATLAAWRIIRRGRMSGRGWRLVLAGALLCLAACLAGLAFTGFAVGLRGASEWSDRGKSPLESILRTPCAKFLGAGKSVGLVAAVVSGDETCLMGFGRTALTAGGTVNGDTLFEIGSITKTFTGLILAIEIQRGRLRLDQPIAGLLPATVRLPDAARGVTLQQLITHSSGLPRLPGGSTAMLGGAFGMLLYGGNPYAALTEQAYLDALQNAKLEFPPGARSSYSNFGVTMLGWLIAKQAGRDYEEMVRAEICEPLRLKNTTVNLSREQERNFATGYRALGKYGALAVGLRSRPWTDGRNLEAAGGLRSDGRDMLAYLQANMQPGKSALDAALRQSHHPLFSIDQSRAVAMGWVVSELEKSKTTILWHNGGTGGFRSFIGFDESGRHGVVILSNSAESVDALALAILRELIERGK